MLDVKELGCGGRFGHARSRRSALAPRVWPHATAIITPSPYSNLPNNRLFYRARTSYWTRTRNVLVTREMNP